MQLRHKRDTIETQIYFIMIAGITGYVREIEENNIILEAAAFRFSLSCPQPVIDTATVGKEISLFTHLNVREDDLSLFGFLSKRQLILFQHLISVSGIGPKIALEILSVGEDSVQHAIANEDVSFLCNIKGIGKKTAERAILELREKMNVLTPLDSSQSSPPKGKIATEEAISALEGLGWKTSEIRKGLQDAPKNLSEAEEIIKWFLTNR